MVKSLPELFVAKIHHSLSSDWLTDIKCPVPAIAPEGSMRENNTEMVVVLKTTNNAFAVCAKVC